MSASLTYPTRDQAPPALPGTAGPAGVALLRAPASAAVESPHARPVLPSFPGGELPPPEPRSQTLLVRTAAVAAILITLGYLIWRGLFTIDPRVWWVSVPFFVLECHALVSLILFAFSLWDVHSQAPARPVKQTSQRVAVFIPTYNESREILLPTVAAAIALPQPHETWVLDDGNRPWVAELAARLGARYVARADRSHAKAGNINHALGLVAADLIVVLDADHVASPDLLTKTLGYFDDPRVALVQTPQDFYNRDSFEHEQGTSAQERSEQRDSYHEQALFYRVIQAGKNRWGGAFCCGTGAIIRLTALREIGGFATETITEDIHTTIRLHRRGWKTVYHNEVLARGLAASTAEQFQLQRFRWGTGAMQVLRVENPFTVSGLSLRQRLAYAATLLGWFEAWRTIGYLLVPIIVLLTGAVPIWAEPTTFMVAFGAAFFSQRVALRLLSRGYGRLVLPVVFELVRMTPNLLATSSLLYGARAKFKVTPKGRLGDDRRRAGAPTLLMAMAVLSGIAGLWFCLVVTERVPLRYEVPWSAYGALFWLVVNTALVMVAIFRVRAVRYAAERRASVRFSTALTGRLAGTQCHIHDVSLTGALVSLAGPDANRHPQDMLAHSLTIDLDGTILRLDAHIRSRRIDDAGRMRYGLEFRPGQDDEQARLALALFNAQIVPEIVRAAA